MQKIKVAPTITAVTLALLLVSLSSLVIAAPDSSAPTCTKPYSPDGPEWLVFFPPHSAELSKRDRTILDELVRAADGYSPVILISGATDAAEVADSDSDLAMRRGTAVRDYLIRAGLPPHSVFFDMAGSLAPLVPTPPDVPEPQNRRAVIIPFGLHGYALARDRAICVDWMKDHCLPAGSSERDQCAAALRWLGDH